MRKIKKIVLAAVIISLFSTPVFAKEKTADDYLSDFENIVPEGSGLEDGEGLFGVGVDKLFSEIFSSVSGAGSEVVGFFLLLLGLGLLFSLADFTAGFGNARLAAAVRSGVSALSALLIFSHLEGLVFSVSENLESLSGFFSALIPIITGISLASGAVTSSGVQAVNMNLTLAVIGKLTSSVLIPLVFMIFSLALVSAVGSSASRLAAGTRSVFNWTLGILTTVLIASISMQSFLATTKDTVALRAAKYALSGSIPMVGSTVSGALSTLTGALSEARAVVGVGSVAVIFTMAASPVIIMLLYRLALSVSLWLFDFVGAGGVHSSFSAFRAALDTLISVYAVSAIVYILEIVIFIRGGVSVFV